MNTKQYLSLFSSACFIVACYVLIGCGGGGGVDAGIGGNVNLTGGVPQEILDEVAKLDDTAVVDPGSSGTSSSGGGTSGGGSSGGGTVQPEDPLQGWPITGEKWFSYHTGDGMFASTFDGMQVHSVGTNGSYPSFCRDYSKMVFQRSNKRVIIKTAAGIETDLGPGKSPVINADGTKIVFQLNTPAGGWDIFTMNIDGSNRQQITFDPSHEFAPTFSHDGQMICYTRFPLKGDPLVPLARAMVVPTSGGTPVDIIPTDHLGLLGMFVNNDQSIMYIGGQAGKRSIRYVKGISDDGPGQQVSFSGTIFTVTPDGSTVIHSTGGKGVIPTIYRTDLATGTTTAIGTGWINNTPLYD